MWRNKAAKLAAMPVAGIIMPIHGIKADRPAL
jgi:hypothetical protein